MSRGPVACTQVYLPAGSSRLEALTPADPMRAADCLHGIRSEFELQFRSSCLACKQDRLVEQEQVE